jgi:hypothetical protein
MPITQATIAIKTDEFLHPYCAMSQTSSGPAIPEKPNPVEIRAIAQERFSLNQFAAA